MVSTMPGARRETRVGRFLPVVSILLIFLIIEGLCALGLLLLHKTMRAKYDPNVSTLSETQKTALRTFLKTGQGQHAHQDPILGWVNISEANTAGMRDDREYEGVPRRGTIRISAFGDSFTYGSDVALGETWAKQLGLLNPSLEVLNYGVGAYGLDQAYLRYRRVGTDYRPHIVFIGYMSENIARHVNVFRPFYTSSYRDVIFTKPRFRVNGDALVLLENPIATLADHERLLRHDREVLAQLGENDYHYQTNYNAGVLDVFRAVRFAKVAWSLVNKGLVNPIFDLDGTYNPNSEAYRVTVKIFETFYRAVLANGALPVILVFPDTNDQQRSRQKKLRRYAPLLNEFRRQGNYYIDVLEALEPHESRHTIEDLTQRWGHYSPLGQRIVAGYIATQLRNWDLTDPTRTKAAVQAARTRVGVAGN
jgi:hypothetical protein